MYRKWSLVITILLLTFSCSSVRKVAEISDGVAVINAHTAVIDNIVDDAIQKGDPSSLPTIKTHTEEIRTEGVAIKEREKNLLEEIAELKNTSFFRKAVPWIPVLLGAGIFIFSWLFTKNVSDTVLGSVLFLSGIAVNILWTFVEAHIGSIFLALTGVAIVWLIINHDTRQSKKRG